MASNKDVVTPSSELFIGRVKWFNNKAGYGFITVTDGSRSGSDIFVHHSSIDVENQQYKYLVQGEYVNFNLINTTSGAHEWQASNVSGIKGGKLMCETRRDFKLARTAYKSEKVETPVEVQTEAPKTPRQRPVPREADSAATPRQRVPRARGEGPREGDKKEWTLVAPKSDDKKPKTTRTRAPRQGSSSESK
jgi:CspA family cold shock protein